MTVEETVGKAIVVRIHDDGAADRWNILNPGYELMHGDRILEINGVRDTASIMLRLQEQERPLELSVRRPMILRVTLHRLPASPRIGLNIVNSGEKSLLVKMIKDGLVKDWNTTHPDMKVLVGDRIIEVNGVKGSFSKILGALRGEGALNFVFQRNCDDGF